MNKEIYLDLVLEQMPRLIGLLDRNPLSKTYGCFDRNYWLYRITDFPGARWQEAALTLALLYKLKNKKNIYYNNENILELIHASLNFWIKMQEENGSFNEWYPHENSYVATAFSTYAVSEIMLNLNIQDEKLLKAVRKAADFLYRKKETRVQNQETGAIIALYNAYLLTNDIKYANKCNEKLENLKNKQKTEGWFTEYNGADIGYLSLAVDYLIKYYEKSGDSTANLMAEKATDFISNFLNPDGSAGGDFASRNTEYLIPSGFEAMDNGKSKIIAGFLRNSLNERKITAIYNLDDRYLAYNAYNYLQAYEKASDELNKVNFKVEEKYFDDAGIYIFENKNYKLIANLKKGAAFKIFFKKRTYNDSGVQVQGKNVNLFSALANDSSIVIQGKRLVSLGNFSIIKTKTFDSLKMIASRAFQETIGNIESVGSLMKEVLRDKVITSNEKSFRKYKRTIEIQDEGIVVTDEIKIPKNSTVILGGKSSYNMVPSSKYFTKDELGAGIIKIKAEKEKIIVKREINTSRITAKSI